MGGLWKKLPVTFAVTTVGVLAIAGIPPFAGFFSKDAILYAAFLHTPGGILLWLVGAITALLTALYMFRLWYLAFLGKPRSEAHPHESPWTMLAPLVLLALLSLTGGWVGIERFSEFLSPSVGPLHLESATAHLELILTLVAVAIALTGWLLAHLLYSARPALPATLAAAAPRAYKLILNKYYVDQIYSYCLIKPLQLFSRYFLGWVVDTAILGGLAWFLAGIANLTGMILQYWQSGNIRSYAAWLTAGAAALLLYVFASWNNLLPFSLNILKGMGH